MPPTPKNAPPDERNPSSCGKCLSLWGIDLIMGKNDAGGGTKRGRPGAGQPPVGMEETTPGPRRKGHRHTERRGDNHQAHQSPEDQRGLRHRPRGPGVGPRRLEAGKARAAER